MLEKKGPHDIISSENLLHYTPNSGAGDSVVIGFEKGLLISPSLEDYARLTQEEVDESVDLIAQVAAKDAQVAAKDAQVAALIE